VGSGGTGKNDTGQAVGTVNGFGSVIVDGVEYEALGAPVVSEVAPATDVVAEVKLGERVAIDFETPGVARQVRVETTISGPVASVAAGVLAVLGQQITVNTGSGAGPRTQFGGGYAQAADVQPGDNVDIHGVLVQAAPSYMIQATRIEKLASPPAYLRVSGLVSNLTKVGTIAFAMAGLNVDATSATLLPSGSVLAEGQAVTLLAAASSLSMPLGGNPVLQAAQVRILKLEDGGLEDVVSGSVASLDTSSETFLLGSLKVNYAAAIVTPAGTTLANRQYVRVSGPVGTDGMLAATAIAIRDDGSGNEASLRGNVSGYDPVAKRLVVRDVNVDVSTAVLQSCPAAGLSNGLFVEVDGSLSANGVVANTVSCLSESPGSTVDRDGVASSVDLVSMSFTLTGDRGQVTVQWNASTFFGDVTPATLSGKKVEVEGTLVNGVLQAAKIKFDD
jgi:hypothetical protein